MKKSMLNRKHPMKRAALKRGESQLKRTRLAPRGKKRHKEDRECNDLEQFAETWKYCDCWLCHDKTGTEINHIAGRTSKLRHHACNLSWVCSRCHRDIVPVIGVPGMFAFKRLRDPEGFDAAVMRELLRAKGQGAGRVA